MGDAGVQAIVEGEEGAVERFIQDIRLKAPPLARVEEVRVERKAATGEFTAFRVERSEKAGLGLLSVVPPDIALCGDCINEMMDPSDRRHVYPFITCINCGPRFTIIEELPYDRPRTSMKVFPLCADCLREYRDPTDRRYHAEPTCCPVCGPWIELRDREGTRIDVPEPIHEAAKLLDESQIVAIKGIGGIHIATKTTDDEVLIRLREAFNRPQQPLAIMSRDLETVKAFANVSETEAELLTSYRRPIVVLERAPSYMLSEFVAPDLDSVGVMLPYSGIHHMLLHYGNDPAYVMTSANIPGLPMLIDNAEAQAKLGGAVDYYLLHNRIIVNRCDDSVVKEIDGRQIFLRRSRGHAPEPVKLAFKSERKVLALGAELNVTVAVLVGDKCFPSQHIGDTTKVETLEYMEGAAQGLMRLLNLESVDLVARDMHPTYATTRIAPRIAERLGGRTVAIQHHHAHLASLMAEHGLDELVGIAADGVGYGPDGTVWGGEVMFADSTSFERVGGLTTQPMPGGDLATQFPARMVAGIFWNVFERAELEHVLKGLCAKGFRYGEREVNVVMRQLERGLNVFQTSSCGRVLDAIACLLDVCHERTYEGEPAIKLEAAAAAGNAERAEIRPQFKEVKGILFLDTSQILSRVLELLRAGVARRHIAAAAQRALANGLAEIAVHAASARGVKVIGGSGGVFHNRAISRSVREAVERARLRFVGHELLPPGDGGISVGQAVVAAKSSSVR